MNRSLVDIIVIELECSILARHQSWCTKQTKHRKKLSIVSLLCATSFRYLWLRDYSPICCSTVKSDRQVQQRHYDKWPAKKRTRKVLANGRLTKQSWPKPPTVDTFLASSLGASLTFLFDGREVSLVSDHFHFAHCIFPTAFVLFRCSCRFISPLSLYRKLSIVKWQTTECGNGGQRFPAS